MIGIPFEYHLTPAENEEQRQWEKVQLDKAWIELKRKKGRTFPNFSPHFK
jgi:hypothetical protein